MIEILMLVINKISSFIIFLLNLEILKFNDKSVTFLGFIGALAIVGIMIKLWMPKP